MTTADPHTLAAVALLRELEDAILDLPRPNRHQLGYEPTWVTGIEDALTLIATYRIHLERTLPCGSS